MLQGVLRFIASITGFGAPRVEVVVKQRASPRGSILSGVVVIRGGLVPMRVRAVRAKLDEYEHAGNRRRRGTLRQTTLSGPTLVRPGDRREIPFALRIPDDARLTRGALPLGAAVGDRVVLRVGGVHITIETPGGRVLTTGAGCLLEASLDLGWWALPRRDQTVLNILEHREIVAVSEAMEALGFRRTERARLTAPSDTTYLRDFEPPVHLAGRLDGVTLNLRVEGSAVTGTLELDRPERGLVERLGALIGADRTRVGVRFDREPLLTGDGDPAPTAALPVLEEVLSAALAEAGDPRWTLLRPAAGPSDRGETLLRPASNVPRHRDDTLLRPTQAQPPVETPEAPEEEVKPEQELRASTGEDAGG